jgi:hypothetical protein
MLASWYWNDMRNWKEGRSGLERKTNLKECAKKQAVSRSAGSSPAMIIYCLDHTR